MTNNFKEWAVEKHRDTNHFYDKTLPYEFHLQMVVNEAEWFNYLIADIPGYKGKIQTIIDAAWGHDLIEDCRVNYNDIVKVADTQVADIIYALTNPKGKNRQERNNHEYYQSINEVPGAAYTKLCDRIANVKYGVLTNSKMVEMYHKENDKFKDMLYQPYLKPMFDKLELLFTLSL